ncbi:hypothetical protein MJO28_012599 [Puccinia striiformis f. sp. tritici]|uniref:Uncharacterized protein n=1 Tax=Puccinia striiformis f. sp. tritici TaxID=168172 RepID=A0ACC0E0N9_9BASI|nr:hypothetical protein MJO28_012599 [Puccinia striiformis f. sp. tritici]
MPSEKISKRHESIWTNAFKINFQITIGSYQIDSEIFHNTRGHGLRFPEYNCNIEFGTTPGIIEVLWKSNDIAHQKIGPTEELKSTKTSTHSRLVIAFSSQKTIESSKIEKNHESSRKISLKKSKISKKSK